MSDPNPPRRPLDAGIINEALRESEASRERAIYMRAPLT
jgi:hypothetical protein